MPTLLLRLSAPLQSWGAHSRFVTRATEQAPTKSGVFGLLAAARGLRRTEPITELLGLRFGTRVDQPGKLVRDFQVERSRNGLTSMPLSYRYYLGDAIFLAAVESEDRELLSGLQDALRSPYFPLYLGRRSCPTAGPIWTALREESLVEALREEPWQASSVHQDGVRSPRVALRMLVDAEEGEPGELIRDEPVSFDPERREYLWRTVSESFVEVENSRYRAPERGEASDHDPMSLLFEEI
ncbi:type I-E CRISPR-associated protein Cas5/CasD [Mycetocola tolaasinivorans]|uniref:Type I-E CRISPR-associated protein Cas5/CasD n=1 Tax=Mycetocola tolaasinivorans TaxID=76635 RepID=A0A3L7A4B2_9MICO|nr:type I-E CRISPR-associated protein Cas5/CasD [Mycetocola tolaasinivorans]RLP74944.1 type I-E CRISPR-associated protein Cas5/CasD [Mycetocola tolaasinivorans]